jgi:hypothetical protein
MLVEDENATNFSGSGVLSAQSAPDAGDEILSETNRFSDSRTKEVAAKGLLTAETNLGNRASASVDFQYKKGVLGDPDTGTVTAPRYQLDVHALRPMVLSFGHFEFAKPSNGVAVAEDGEGWRLSYDNFSISQLFNVDGGPSIHKDDVRHDKEVVAQLQNVGSLKYVLEAVNLVGVYGRVSYERKDAAAPADATAAPAATTPARPHGVDHQYWTYGMEALLTGAAGRLRGSASIYRSGRSAVNSSNFVRQHGLVLDTAWSWTHFGDVDNDTQTREILYFFSAEAAQAGDFAGEHQAFGPDTRFFSGFLGNLDLDAGLGEGLANKRYLSLGFTDQRFSLLQAVACLLKVPEKDIASKSSSATWHYYHSTTDTHRGRLGNELDFKFDIETPAKVTSSVSVTYFQPSGYLGIILGRENSSRKGWWEISSSVKIALGQ